MSEPTKINAGDTIEFSKSLADYPASEYDLFYKIIGSTSISAAVEADADGDDFELTIPSSVTTLFAKGTYRLVGYVTGADSFQATVYDQPLEIGYNYATMTAASDMREHWQKIIDALKAAMLSRASIMQQAMTEPLSGKSIQYLDLKQMQDGISYAESQLELVANGGRRKQVRLQFT